MPRLARPALAAALVAAALAPAPARAEEGDEDFEPVQSVRLMSVGPSPQGDAMASVEVGWLRSGIRMDIGFGIGLDLVLKADAWLLQGGIDSQNAIAAGLRWAPFSDGPFRASIEGTAGQVFLGGGRGLENVAFFRGELVLGAAFDPVLVYGRAAVRGLHSTAAYRDDWARDEELGAGVEWAWRKLRLGAEGYVWSRPSKGGLGQWRTRVGWAF